MMTEDPGCYERDVEDLARHCMLLQSALRPVMARWPVTVDDFLAKARWAADWAANPQGPYRHRLVITQSMVVELGRHLEASQSRTFNTGWRYKSFMGLPVTVCRSSTYRNLPPFFMLIKDPDVPYLPDDHRQDAIHYAFRATAVVRPRHDRP
jgi:hypothetical protein